MLVKGATVVINRPCPNLNDSLGKPPLKLVYAGIITHRSFMWLLLHIHTSAHCRQFQMTFSFFPG